MFNRRACYGIKLRGIKFFSISGEGARAQTQTQSIFGYSLTRVFITILTCRSRVGRPHTILPFGSPNATHSVPAATLKNYWWKPHSSDFYGLSYFLKILGRLGGGSWDPLEARSRYAEIYIVIRLISRL